MKITRRQLRQIISEVIAEGDGPADMNNDGVIDSPELYLHFDVDNDGVVTPQDYADHVNFHCENPEILAPYLDHRDGVEEMGVPCPSSYRAVGDKMIGSPSKIMQMIEPIMEETGATCPSSAAQALADVVHFMKFRR